MAYWFDYDIKNFSETYKEAVETEDDTVQQLVLETRLLTLENIITGGKKESIGALVDRNELIYKEILNKIIKNNKEKLN